MKQKKSGFTLLELLIVVAILAVLVALAMPFFQDYLSRSRIAAAEADLTSFQKALASYDQLETEMFTTGNVWTDLIGKYLQDFRTVDTQTAPIDPWGNDYQISVAEGAVWSYGPDGLAGNGTLPTTGRFPTGDDILKTWKPEFFISDARVVGEGNTVEVTFTRKISDYDEANVPTDITMTPAGGIDADNNTFQRVSDTVCRITFDDAVTYAGGIATITFDTAAITVTAQDGKTLDSTDLKPDGSAANAFGIAQ